ncbi:MAG: hypothetical protein HYT98_04205 [Candidatus Sungbacteria bacterium]|nr:hypothetical protein [Candidatus Sungbacteria bacterium]
MQKPSSRVYVKNRSITRLVLEKLAEGGKVFLDAFFPPQYSFTSSGRRLFGLDSSPEVSPRTLSAILSRLKRHGLVGRNGSSRNSRWHITTKGKLRLHKRQEIVLEIPEKDGIPRLVIFDIPERERRKRDIVRMELTACGFRHLQKSVWLGFNPLPQQFIERLDELRLKNKVHILSIQKSGTIENLLKN